MSSYVTSLTAALSLAVTIHAQAATPMPQPLQLKFGVYSYKRATEVYKSFQPATEALQQSLTKLLQRPVQIDLCIDKTYEDCLDKFVRGEIDFVRFGPASYLLAKQRNPAVELLVAEQEDGKKVCQGVIAVRTDSDIRTLADLAGKSFAFGDEQSTIGRYLSQALLVEAGVRARDLKSFKYLDRHDIVFKVVEIGDFDAGAMHINTFHELNGKTRKLRILGEPFDNVGKPWIARAGLEPALQQALRRALLELTDREALKALKVDGFMVAADKDYDPVRKGMRLAKDFLAPATLPEPAPMPGKK